MRKEEMFTGFEGYGLLLTSFYFHVFSGGLPRLSETCGTAAWIAVLIGSVLATGVLLLYYLLLKKFSGKNILQISEDILGPWLSKLFQAYLFCFILAFITNNLLDGVRLLVYNTYSQSRYIYLTTVILAAVYVVALYPMKSLARTTSVAVPLFFFSVALIIVLATNQYEPRYLTPILGYGPAAILRTSVFQISNVDGLLVLMVFADRFTSAKTFRKNGLWAVGGAFLMFVMTTLSYLMSTPYTLAPYNDSGLLDVATSIYISRFLQRFEVVFIIFVALGKILIICIAVVAAKKTYANMFRIPVDRERAVILPILLIVFGVSQLMFNEHGLGVAFSNFIRRTNVFITLGVLAVLLAGSLLYKKPRGSGGRALRAVCLVLVLGLCTPALSGCDTMTEPDEEIFTVVLGYDRSDTETLRITMKIMPEDKNSAGGEGGGEFADAEGAKTEDIVPDNVFIVDAPCNLPANDLISTVLPKHISLLHVKMVVISEELAREDINLLISPIVRYNEIKPSIALVICEGRAQDFISSRGSNLIPFLPLETEMILKQDKGNASYLVRTMGQVYNTYSGGYGDALVMYGGLSGNTAQDKARMDQTNDDADDNALDVAPAEDVKEAEDSGGGESGGDGESSDGSSQEEMGESSQTSEETGASEGPESSEPTGSSEPSDLVPSGSLDEKLESPDDDYTGFGEGLRTMDEVLESPSDQDRSPEPSAGGMVTEDGDTSYVYNDDPEVGYLQGYFPGEIPIVTTVEPQIAGMAVMRGSQMVGRINTHETALFMMADGCFDSIIAVRDPFKPNLYVMFYGQNRQKNRIKTRIDEDGVPHIDIKMYLQLELAIVHNTEANYKLSDNREKLRVYTKEYLEGEIQELIERTQLEFDADILRLGRYVAGNFLTIDEWESYGWRDKYKDAVINIDLDVRL